MKYEFTREKKTVDGVVVHRIRATQDFCLANARASQFRGWKKFDGIYLIEIKKGTLGGWLESMDNLSQDGLAWVMDDACVYGNARVSGAAIVCDAAKVYGEAKVQDFALVEDEAQVGDGALIKCHATISDHAVVKGGQVIDEAKIFGYADVLNASVEDNATIGGNAYVHNNGDLDFFILGHATVRDNARIVGNEGGSHIYVYGTVIEDANIGDDVWIDGDAIVRGHSRLCGHIDISDDAVICFPEQQGEAWQEECLCSRVPAEIGKNAYILSEHDLVAFDLTFNCDKQCVSFYPDKERRIYAKICDEGDGTPALLVDDEEELERQFANWYTDGYSSVPKGPTVSLLMEMSRYAKSYFEQLELEKSADSLKKNEPAE